MYEDIYFLNPQEALRVASQQNRYNSGASLQICYYNGEKIDSNLPNLIQLPLNNLLDSLAHGIYRIPSQINFDGLELSTEIQTEIEMSFKLSIEQVKIYRKKLNAEYFQKSKNAKPDFSEPLRFYIHASSNTDVMQYISKNIADTLKSMGYDVLFNLYIGIEDRGCLKTLCEFNPHATININHLNNEYISKDTFNFVWFQDLMPVLINENKIDLRERDFIFHLTEGLEKIINKKSIKSKYQPFCMDENKYKARKDIKKEKKIVFIGSSYSEKLKPFKTDSKFEKIYNEAVEIFERKSYLKDLKHKDSDIRYLMDKYNKSEKYIGNIYGYIIRDYCIEKLCSVASDYEIEVYGYGWENNDIVKPYFRGVVENGEDVSKIYNGATYGYCPGGYILMQRTLESAFSETIPLVLDTRADMQDIYDTRTEEAIEFFHIKDLENILTKDAPKDKKYDYIKEHYSYRHFAQKFVDIIKKGTN